MSHLSNGIFANVFDATNGAILKPTCSSKGNSYTIPPIGNNLQSIHIERRMSHVKDNVTIGFEGQTRALQDCTALVKPPVTCVINKKISSLTGPLLKSKLIQSTMTRLGSVETGLEWAVKMMNDEISGRLKVFSNRISNVNTVQGDINSGADTGGGGGGPGGPQTS